MSEEIASTYPTPRTEGAGETYARSASAASGLKIYLILVMLIPLTFLTSAIPIVRSSAFPIEAGDPFLLNPDYAFSLKHVDCDVVIAGDSTAITGLDPTVVAGATGLKTCNIAQSRSALEVVGTLALDTYLEHNRPPRYIVMQFAPETLAHGRDDFFWPEGLTILLRQKSLLQSLPVLALHPAEFYEFSLWAIKAKVRSLSHPPADFRQTEATFRSRGGLLVLPKPPESHCGNNLAFRQPNSEWIHSLKDKYARNGTDVIINVAPVPDCTPDAQRMTESLRGITDNSLVLYPIGLFCDLDRHLTLEGADRSSLGLAQQLMPLMSSH